MPKKRYCVSLTNEEREELLTIVSKGTNSARTVMRANVLLVADESLKIKKPSDEAIAELYYVNRQTVQTIRRTYSENGLDAAIKRNTYSE